ncbi:MAG: acyltransferase family protein [Sphingomonadaceae bacterium]
MNIKGYREDIDGLRALAVLPVLLFHAHVPGFSGGYVGVDIFFVISGFLITGIIAREIDRGDFSILKFYERRARRILPALFAMVAFVLAAATIFYLPGDFEGVPRSALAALGFCANIWFFLQAGYFAGDAHSMPLLHTWSLGVEEQFYIGFPLILIAITKWLPKGRKLAIAAMAAISFAIAVWTQDWGDSSAFYLLPARAWELFAGSFLALGMIPALRSRVAREAVALAGVVAIALAVALYDAQTVFPGVTALLPVLGSAALIHCAPGTTTGRVLAWKPLVWIGLISYSLYLWHWPLIVFTQYRLGGPLEIWHSAALIAASILVAWASWRWIEAPFRDSHRFPQKRIFAWSGGGMAALGAIALAMLPAGGWPDRFDARTSRLAQGAQDISPMREECNSVPLAQAQAHCTLGAKVSADAVVWGDSHGVEIAYALGQTLKSEGKSIAQRTHASCPPALGYDDPVNPTCAPFNRDVAAEIAANPQIATVYLVGFWSDRRYDQPGFIAQIEKTFDILQDAGKEVVLVGAVPTQPFNVPRTLALASARGEDPASVAGSSMARHRGNEEWFARHYREWRARGVEIFDPAAVLGTGSGTRIVEDGHPLYFDTHHLSLTGARKLVSGLEEWRVGENRNYRQ